MSKMLEEMRDTNDRIVELESLKSQAEEEIQKLQELLEEADAQLR